MTDKDKTVHDNLYDEIHAVIHSELERDYKDSLYWSSVGLIGQNDRIIWRTHVNTKFDHESHKYPCKDNGCTPEESRTVPPCIKDNIKQECAIRIHLNKLGQITMADGSSSLAEASLKYFRATDGEHPYILTSESIDHKWMETKANIIDYLIKKNIINVIDQNAVNDELGKLTKEYDDALNEEDSVEEIVKLYNKWGFLDDEEECSGPDYHIAALYKFCHEKCVPSERGFTVALIPLVLYSGRIPRYIGAIGICESGDQKKEGERHIWYHLPKLKALVLPLVRNYSYVYGITPNVADDKIKKLVRELLCHKFGEHLYSHYKRTADVLSWHKEQPSDAMTEVKKLFDSDNEWANQGFPRSLYGYLSTIKNYPATREWKKPIGAYPFKIKILQKFLERNFEDMRDKIKLIDLNDNQHPDNELLLWPVVPGVISLVSIIKIFHVLNEYKDKKSNVENVSIRYKRDGYIYKYEIIFSLVMSAYGLEDRWMKSLKHLPPPGETSDIIYRCVYGDLDTLYGDEIRRYKYTTNKYMYDSLVSECDFPLFNLRFGDSSVSLLWSVERKKE